MTTNAGSASASCVGFNSGSKKAAEDDTKKALLTFLRPEFINRVDEIITFRSLDVSDFERIAVIMLEELRNVIEKKPMEFNYTSDVPKLIAEKSYSAKFGARNMRRYIQTNIEDSLAESVPVEPGRTSLTPSVNVAPTILAPTLPVPQYGGWPSA